MCHQSVLSFADRLDVSGKTVIEVGAYDVNGSPQLKMRQRATEYVGIDISAGPGVDRVLNAEELISTFGANSFDVVICMEMLEHAQNWRECIYNMKTVCRESILITTRSKGFPFHGYPHDYWRYSLENMAKIFADFDIEELLADPQQPGVMMIAHKTDRQPVDLSKIELEAV